MILKTITDYLDTWLEKKIKTTVNQEDVNLYNKIADTVDKFNITLSHISSRVLNNNLSWSLTPNIAQDTLNIVTKIKNEILDIIKKKIENEREKPSNTIDDALEYVNLFFEPLVVFLVKMKDNK